MNTNPVTTSHFASHAPTPRKVCIAKNPPRGFRGLHVLDLAPSHPWARNWQESYRNDLAARFPLGKGLAELLADIAAKVPSPVLCCYERNRNECHRSILAEYIEQHLGFAVEEWNAATDGR